MYFYNIEATITRLEMDFSEAKAHETANELDYRHKTLYEKNYEEGVLFIASIKPADKKIVLGALILKPNGLGKCLSSFLEAMDIGCEITATEEITMEGLRALFDLTRHDNFSHNNRARLFEKMGIYALYSDVDLEYKEDMVPDDNTRAQLNKKAAHLLFCETLIPEIDRVFMPAKAISVGHPVHYMLHSEDNETSVGAAEVLLTALYKNKRISNKRYGILDFKETLDSSYDGISISEYEAMYKICSGGAVIVLLEKYYADESDNLTTKMREVERACETALKYRNNVLTVFALPRSAKNIRSLMKEHLGDMTFVEIHEDTVSAKAAKDYLRYLAKEQGVQADKSLYKNITEEKTYKSSMLKREFTLWFNNRLKTHYYPQYAAFESASKATAKQKPKGSAYKELESLVGLAEAKEVITQAVDYFKAQKLFRERGWSDMRPSMHMVFSGAPGTAKTTVARLFAEIMRDNGMLSVGDLVEVGRADLVGKYVGWTAKEIVKLFKRADGSVLFIDEAYSLVDDRDGSYGDEAINTIVAEMENRRDDIVVIFAGYTDKMEGFLQKNPGLRSRIAFHVPFADYNEGELYQILELMVKNQEIELDKDVRDKVLPILSSAMKEPDFGNGRFVRNLFEKARMKQSSRLLRMDVDNVSKNEVSTLTAEDFAPLMMGFRKNKTIGFCA